MKKIKQYVFICSLLLAAYFNVSFAHHYDKTKYMQVDPEFLEDWRYTDGGRFSDSLEGLIQLFIQDDERRVGNTLCRVSEYDVAPWEDVLFAYNLVTHREADISITRYVRSAGRCLPPSTINSTIFSDRRVQCPLDSMGHGNPRPDGVCLVERVIDKNPVSCNTTANPCDIRTGAKYRNETDFSYGGLIFTRNYHSQNLTNQGFGLGWHNPFFKHLEVSGDNLLVFEGTGRGEPWRRESGVWTGDPDSDYLVTESTNGFTVTLQRGGVHEYDLSGTLLSETDPTGKVTSYAYDVNNRLTTVTDHYQQSINFEYSTDGKNHIVKVTDATGVEYGYEYDVDDNLIAVIYPDQDTDLTNNPRRIYHYEDANFPNHLTGITNANGERYATFAYGADGKAIESALSPTTNTIGQERVQLNFQ